MYKNVAFIPVRGGSKSVPHKNIKTIAGKPLVYWCLKAANSCGKIERIFVSTDDEQIKSVVDSFLFENVEVISRSSETATDTSSTESAMLEFAKKYVFENMILIQATSPLLTSSDLYSGFEIFEKPDTDSVLSCVKQKRFIWKTDVNDVASPVNYDYNSRPRRQEFDGYFVENGAFYITGRERFLKSENRISGKIRICEMPEETYYEIDEPSDWKIIEKLLEERNKITASDISTMNYKLFLMDCDGVLTDGGMYYSEDGDELKRFSTYDGMGIKRLKENGIIVGLITGEDRQLNKRRAEKLGFDIIRQGVSDKISVVRDVCNQYGVELSETVYVGDDINDLEVLKAVGLGCTVANGRPEIKKISKYIASAGGGYGAVREIADLILGEQNV